MAKKTASTEKNPIEAPSFTDEHYFKFKMLELMPQGGRYPKQLNALFGMERYHGLRVAPRAARRPARCAISW